MTDLPPLKPGFTWGKPVRVKNLVVGDYVSSPGNRRRSSIHGTITKIARVNLTLTSVYMGQPMPDMKTPISDLLDPVEEMIPNTVKRGNVFHPLIK